MSAIKARFGTDIRRIPVYGEDLAYDDLVRRLMRVFNVNNDVVIKYLDDGALLARPYSRFLVCDKTVINNNAFRRADGELVTIADDADLMLAKHALRGSALRLTLTGRCALSPFPPFQRCGNNGVFLCLVPQHRAKVPRAPTMSVWN